MTGEQLHFSDEQFCFIALHKHLPKWAKTRRQVKQEKLARLRRKHYFHKLLAVAVTHIPQNS